MLANLLKNSEWRDLAEYASPALFDVLSPTAALGQLGALAKSLARKGIANETIASLNAALVQVQLPVVVYQGSGGSSHQDAGSTLLSQSQAELVLQLYFCQIFACQQAILDFRGMSFRDGGMSRESGQHMLAWHPSSLSVVWQDKFISAIRTMYSSFYHSDHPSFRSALKVLGLEAAENILIEHFGSNQTDHAFCQRSFVRTFHQVFLAAKQAKQRIHPQFLPFGLSLAALYQTLEETNLRFNVRHLFLDVESGIGLR